MSGVYLNYCFCDITHDIEDVYSINYTNKELLNKLRNDYPEFVFYRAGDRIFYWRKHQSTKSEVHGLASTKVEISVDTHPTLISRMLEEKIVDCFKAVHQYEVYYEKYSHCFVAKKINPVYSDSVLNVYNCCKIKTYFFRQNDKLYFGFTVSTNLKYKFNIAKEQCAQYGIDSKGLSEDRSGKIAANTRAISRYKEIVGDKSKLSALDDEYSDKAKQFTIIKSVIGWTGKRLIGKLYGNIEITDVRSNYLPYNDVFENEIISAPKRYYANDKIIPGKPSAALVEVGPYMAQTGDSNIKVTLIALKDNEGSLNIFTRQLSDKMNSLFRLNLCFNYIWVSNNSTSAFVEAVLPINAKNTDIAIFILKKDSRYMNPLTSPYYPCKAKLIGQEVPTQCICIETIKRINDFILGNIALNLYAKIGGTAWGIEKKSTTIKELIIGIGATINYNKCLTMSIANVFDNSGVYLAGACRPIANTDNYVEELESLIQDLFTNILTGEKEVHLIFHIFKSVGQNKEIQALENVLHKIKDITVAYSFVHLGYGHNFRMFCNDGKSLLHKGQYIQLSQLESLLIVNDKSVIPLKVSIDKRSTLKDIYYVTQQAFFFAHLSERSFIPSKKPITILYPSIMASLVEKLKVIDNWDYAKLRVKGVTEKLWFL